MSSKNWLQAAGIVWSLLTKAARLGSTLNYEDVAPHIATNPLSVAFALGPIQSYCMGHSPPLPPLTALVVGKQSRMPGSGFIAWPLDDLASGRSLVYGFDWNRIPNPFLKFEPHEDEEYFVRLLLNSPNQAAAVYSRVANRGLSQDVFRAAVRKAYGNRCAMCGLSLRSALDAAHIIPWHLANPENRIDPRNGVLLCATHHRLFDRGEITISESYRITFPHPRGELRIETDADQRHTEKLAGDSLRLPKRVELHPFAHAFRHHHRMYKWGPLP